jgi:hypothetical protein
MIARLSSSSARLIRLPPWPRLPAPHDALTAGHRTWCGAGMTSTGGVGAALAVGLDRLSSLLSDQKHLRYAP